MRHNYVYDVLFHRWEDRERRLEAKREHMPSVNSFPTELRKTEWRSKSLKKKEGELPSTSKEVQSAKL